MNELTTLPREDLQSRHDTARLMLETLEIEAALKAVLPDQRVVNESWGDLIDPREHLYDDPNWGVQRHVPISQIGDREDGRFRPVFETETELAIIRGGARLMCSMVDAAINIQGVLVDYTIGKGCDYKATTAEGYEEVRGLTSRVQKVLDTLNDLNEWQGSGEREAHKRSREDGEVLVWLVPDGWKTRLRFIEPDQLRDPQSFGRDLEAWLGVQESYVSSWSFGVHTRRAVPSEPLGYHIAFDAGGNDYEYISTARMEHVKRNVPRNVKRGVSDYYPVQRWLNHAEKVLGNTSAGAAIQAAVAFIRQHAPSTTSGQASGMASSLAYNRTTQSTPLGSRIRNAQQYEAGTILDISYGMEYKPGPMGSERAPNFINVVQAAMRMAGIRWAIPEYMLTGDASNANYASTLVSEAPFVKAREADQQEYVKAFRSIAWKAVRIAYEAGLFEQFGLSWGQLEAIVDIQVTPPAVATRDPQARATSNEIEIRSGTLSRRTAMIEAGRDPDAEADQMAAEGWAPAGGAMPMGGEVAAAGGEYSQMSRLQQKRNFSSVLDAMKRFASGEITRVVAADYLRSIGKSPESVEELLNDAADGTVDSPVEEATITASVAAALESVTTTEEARDVLQGLSG